MAAALASSTGGMLSIMALSWDFNDDCTKVLADIDNHNIIFIDPPWGGKSYKSHNNLKLRLSNVSLETMCNHIMDTSIMKHTPELIVMKLPTNYDIKHLYNTIKSKSTGNLFNTEANKRTFKSIWFEFCRTTDEVIITKHYNNTLTLFIGFYRNCSISSNSDKMLSLKFLS